MMSHTHFKIQELRQQSQQKVLESLLAFIAALYITAILPSLLIRYIYNDPNLLTQPMVLEYIPVISFGAAVLYLVYAVVGNISRASKIKALTNEAELMGDNCACDHSHEETELAELESIVEDVLQEETRTTAKPRTTKRSNKKSKR